jgi:hypothetical protein
MKVIHCERGDQTPNGSIYIGRPGFFGNPFRMTVDTEEERERVIDLYRIWFHSQVDTRLDYRDAILSLRGHDLSCYCPPNPCHGDVIIAWLEKHKE